MKIKRRTILKILKFSKYELADAKKNLLAKGLDFFLARKQLNYAI